MDEISMWLFGVHLPHTPTMSQPNLVAQLINCTGEENVNIEKIQRCCRLKVTKDAQSLDSCGNSSKNLAEDLTNSLSKDKSAVEMS